MTGETVVPKKVLIVEDYPDCREFMKLLLETFGYSVLEAGDGHEAIETVKKESPDLILMDMAMPVMDGLTPTKIIRNLDDGAEIPIIALTASTNSFYKEALNAGCDEVIKKPFESERLKSLLSYYLPPNYS
jgi:CheY-like chemotaxis protein